MTTGTALGGAERTHSSISEALAGHRNALGLIRLVLAALVIFDHAFPLGGWGRDPFWELTRGQASLGSIAVSGFFAISGYLIAKSAMTSDVVQFMWRRVLRIFPAYWGVLTVTALVVAPTIWVTAGGALGEFFRQAPNGPFAYLSQNWTMKIGTYGIYDIFEATTPYGLTVQSSVFNGSIWTLIYEWQCYLLVAVLVAFGVFSKARVLVPLLTATFFVVRILNVSSPESLGAIAPFLADTQFVALTFTFLVGSTLAVYSKQVPFDTRLGLLSGIIVLVTLRYGAFNTIGIFAGAYFVLFLAARLPKAVHWIGAKNDYSYGVYVYGFLVQQVLAYCGLHHWGYVPYTLIALAVAFVCAWLSWHFIEKRAMALKGWGPGRGVAYWSHRVLPSRNSDVVPLVSEVDAGALGQRTKESDK